MNKTPVLLLGLFDTAIMTARCFQDSNIPVFGLDYQYDHPGFVSRIIKSAHMPNPSDESDWLSFLLDWLDRCSQKFVLIPTSDEFALLAAKHNEKLSKYTYSLLPFLNELNKIIERDQQFESVKQSGLLVPRYVKGPVENCNDFSLNFPLAIKPISVIEWKKYFNNKGFIINNREELENSLEMINCNPARYLIQEIIVGDTKNNYEVNSLYLPNGDYFSHTIRKIRQFPDNFGTATCIETCPNPELEEMAKKYIMKANLYGFTNIEFKYSESTKDYYYIETNPRVWLQVNLSAFVGLNFPLMYYEYLTKGKISSFHPILRYGKWVDPAPDFLHLWRYCNQKNLKLSYYFRDWRSAKTTGLFSINDPLPILREYRYGLRLLGSKKKNNQKEF